MVQASAQSSSTGSESAAPANKNPIVCIWKLRTKAERKELFQTTIPNWVEEKTMLDFHSDRAQVRNSFC